uniref:Uncharacterized protein n=1 Tax=candidate division CPR3 bacterium TaxID=2268181 RepID=A0A7C4R5Z1_UNCC3
METAEIRLKAEKLLSELFDSEKDLFAICFYLSEKYRDCAIEIVRIKEDELGEKKPFIVLPKLREYLDSLFPDSNERLMAKQRLEKILEEKYVIESAIALLYRNSKERFSKKST